MPLPDSLAQLLAQPDFAFNQLLTWLDEHYNFTPTAFQNGSQHNPAGQNNGACRWLYLAQQLQLSPEQTLQGFAEHYQAVLRTPDGQDHGNIRQFMQQGFAGLQFEGAPLQAKTLG
jgi:hypothetical protein